MNSASHFTTTQRRNDADDGIHRCRTMSWRRGYIHADATKTESLAIVASLRRKCGTPHGRETFFGRGFAAPGASAFIGGFKKCSAFVVSVVSSLRRGEKWNTRCSATILAALLCSTALAGIAQTQPADIQYKGQTASGQAIVIPAGDKPTVLLFYRPGQRQSDDALQELKKTTDNKPAIQSFIVVSGPNVFDRAASPYPVLIDREYALSGKMNVHAWPTTVIVNGQGDTLAHVGGISPSYGLEVSSYLAFVSGEIDQTTLDKRLTNPQEVKDTSAQAAGRHLQVARKLFASGQFDSALDQTDLGLKLDAANQSLKLFRIRVLLAKGSTAEAKASLEQLDATNVPPGQLRFLQGLTAAAAGDLEQAQALLQEATRLSPSPAEAWYELGKVCQSRGDHPKAAAAFKAAYEHK